MTHSELPAAADRKTVEFLRLLGPGCPVRFREADLGRRLHAGAGAMRRIFRILEKRGYRFRNGREGERILAGRPDTISAEEVLSGLSTRKMGRPFLSFLRLDSTNDVALEMARQGAPEGTVVAAEHQAKGRGRLGRSWAGCSGKGLTFSLVLRPRLPADEVPVLTLAAASALAKTLRSFGAHPGIKWPNDVLLGGKKACGILTEMQAEPDRAAFVVVGIGVNLNQLRPDFPEGLRTSATSLRLALGRPVRRARFLQEALLNLEEAYDWVKRREGSRVLAAWRRWEEVTGRQVRVTQVDRSFFAQALHVDGKGALWVRADSGMVERLTAGDVEVLRLGRRRSIRRATRRGVSDRMKRKRFPLGRG